jgi:di/tricarboxylate transporter
VDAFGWDAWVTVAVIGAMIVALVRDLARPDLILAGCLGALLLFGVLSSDEAIAGFANPAVITVGALFVVAAGVQNTGALGFADRFLFPRSARAGLATGRLMLVTASLSAFLNNTPIVAMFIPRVQAWCAAHGVAPSKLMIPLSYGAIVGGMTTLIGTSTNLLVAGLMQSGGHGRLGMFDLAWAGLPAALAVIAYFTLVGHRLLPDRKRSGTVFGDGLKRCLFEVRVAGGSPLAGQTVQAAGFRALGDAYLIHLRRGDEIIPSSPQAVLQEHDVLSFVGSASVLDRLLEQPGLEKVISGVDDAGGQTLPLFEAVVSASSSLIGRSLRDAGFREHYRGVVVGIQRNEAAIEGPLARVPIRAGDLLLVEASNGFDKRWNQNREEFYLVAPRRGEKPRPQQSRAPLALAILLGVILIAALDIAPIVTTAFVGGLAMVATGCVSSRQARRAVDIPVLILIAAALGIGRAIETTGLAGAVAHVITEFSPVLGVVGLVAAVYVATSLLTEIITNNAAAALMLGIGMAAAGDLGVPPHAFAVAVAIAASASFLTPVGYQTNLMVMSPGGYRFVDYVRSGAAANLIVAVTTIVMIWLVWL